MKKFIIEEAFWDVFPNAKIGIILVKGINNRIDNSEIYEQMLLACRASNYCFNKLHY